MELTLGSALRVNAARYPNKVAIICGDRKITYREFNERVNRLANGLLGMGLKKGDKVSILLYNCPEYLEAYFALAKAGLVGVPVNYRLVPEDVKRIAIHSDSTAMIVGNELLGMIEDLKPQLPYGEGRYITVGDVKSGFQKYENLLEKASSREPSVDVKETDLCNIMYTSGTTGDPKGVMGSHRRWALMFFCSAAEWKYSARDHNLVAGPLYSAYCHGPLANIYFGATQTLMRTFDPEETLRLADRDKVSNIFLAPTMYTLILAIPQKTRESYDVSSVKRLFSGMAPLLTQTKLEALEYFKEAELYEVYSSTEMGIVTTLKPEDQLRKTRCVGPPVLPVEVRLFDDEGREVPRGEVGELYALSPLTMEGYYKDPEKTRQAFRGNWVTSGDLARMDEEGYYYIVDRKKDMIISGGLNIYPIEIDEIIAQHPKVLEVATIGVPDKKWGETCMAVVVAKPGAECTEKEIIDYCEGKLARYKIPRSVEFVSELPKNASGKILKKELRKRYWEDQEAQI